MAKSVVERPPLGGLEERYMPSVIKHLDNVDITDEEGRYLHWDKLKWRIEPRSEAQNIWFAIKFKRLMRLKSISLKDPKGERFAYCIPHSMEAKLYQIATVGVRNLGAISGEPASSGVKNQFLVSSLIMEEAISSAQLEGAATTREVAKQMLEANREPKSEDEQMILNNYWLLSLLKKPANSR